MDTVPKRKTKRVTQMNLGSNWTEIARRGIKFIQVRRNTHLQNILGRDPVSDHCAIVFLDAA